MPNTAFEPALSLQSFQSLVLELSRAEVRPLQPLKPCWRIGEQRLTQQKLCRTLPKSIVGRNRKQPSHTRCNHLVRQMATPPTRNHGHQNKFSITKIGLFDLTWHSHSCHSRKGRATEVVTKTNKLEKICWHHILKKQYSILAQPGFLWEVRLAKAKLKASNGWVRYSWARAKGKLKTHIFAVTATTTTTTRTGPMAWL